MKVMVIGATRKAGLAIIQTLAKEGCDVFGCDFVELPFKAHSRFSTPYYLLPKPHHTDFEGRLISLIQKIQPDVLMAVHEIEWIYPVKNKIEQLTNILVPTSEGFHAAYDNEKTHTVCSDLGIGCPKIVSSEEAFANLSRKLKKKDSLKYVVKPKKDIGGAQGVSIVDDADGFIKAEKDANNLFGPTFTVEYIPGGPENMRTVNLLFDRDSRLVAAFTTKKIRQCPNQGGITALSISTREWDLVEMMLPFFQKFKWQGVAEAEIKIDERDQQPKLIEINPRFWSYIGFPAHCGINFPLLNCYLAAGKNISNLRSKDYSVGVKYINYNAYLKSIKEELFTANNKIATIRKIASEIKGKKVTNRILEGDYWVLLAKFLFETSARYKSRTKYNHKI